MADRRRKKKNRALCFAAWVALIALLLLGGYELLLVPEGAAFSAQENRMLAERPGFSLRAFLDGSFADGVEKYLSDRFPGRAGIIDFDRAAKQVGSFATWEEYARVVENDVAIMEREPEELPDEPIVTPRPTRTPTPTPEPTETPAPTPTSEPSPLAADASIADTPVPSDTPEPTQTPVPTATPRPTKAPVELSDFPRELHFYLLDGQTKSSAQVQSRNALYTESNLFNAYASLLPEGGVFVMTIVPNSFRASRVLSYADPQGMTSEIEPFIHAVTVDNVTALSTADLLSKPLIQGEYVFFRTDMHWTPYGAYLVVSRMLEEAGETLPPYEDFPKTQEHPFLGTLYRDSHSKQMEDNPDTLDILTPLHPVRVRRYTTPDSFEEVPFIDPDATPRDRYTVYLGGPKGNWTVIERTDLAADAEKKTCLVISDSYGLCTMPFFAQAYDRAILYDPRYYEKGNMGSVADLIESWGVRDIYLVAGEGNIYGYPFYSLCNRQF